MSWLLSPRSLALAAAFAAAAALAAALTRAHVALGPRLGHVAPPDAFHRGPVSLSGGVGIWLALLAVTVAVSSLSPDGWLVLGASLAMVALGLWDDLAPLRPGQKLLLQAAVATVAAGLGLAFETPALGVLAVPLSVVWLVGMSNAFNLIDNMDGLAGGVAVIAACFLALQAMLDRDPSLALLAAAFAGAHAGFLAFNFKPALIFMGDCGSMGAGFFLGALAIAGSWRSASNLLLVLATPVLLFAVPIFNLLFVLVARKLSGVPVFHGRADHINYRLVAHGLSEREAVLAVYALSAACGALAVWYTQLSNSTLVAFVGVTTVGFLYLAVFLYEASVRGFYRDFAVAQNGGPDLSRLRLARYWWPVVQLGADVVLVSVAYYLAYLLRFDGDVPAVQERNLVLTLPLVVLLKVGAFLLFRLYGGHWRYVGIRDLLRLAAAVGLGQAAVGAAALVLWPGPLSRSVLVIDALLTTVLVGASRMLLPLLRESIRSRRPAGTGPRAVIVGANDRGELLLRLSRQDRGLALTVVGFVDDDLRHTKARIHGVEVLGPVSELPGLCRRRGIELAVVALPAAPANRIVEIAELCRRAGVRCAVLSLSLDEPAVLVGEAA